VPGFFIHDVVLVYLLFIRSLVSRHDREPVDLSYSTLHKIEENHQLSSSDRHLVVVVIDLLRTSLSSLVDSIIDSFDIGLVIVALLL
jgi:hypothetical protein